MLSFNHEKYIGKAIDSVLNQSYGDLELIIVDDGSKDHSKEIIEGYKAKDGRVKAIYHGRNCGIAETHNDGVREAKGKFVAFIDSDDLWTERKLEKQLEVLRKNENLVVWSDGELIDQKDRLIGTSFVEFSAAEKRRKSGKIMKDLLVTGFVFGSCLVLKRASAANVPFNRSLKYLNDYLFVVELAKRFPFYFIDEPLWKYRRHGKNTLCGDWENWAKDDALLRRIFLERYGDEMSNRTKAYNYFLVAHNYARLNRIGEARQFVAKALIPSNWKYKENFYYFAALASDRILKSRFISSPIMTPPP